MRYGRHEFTIPRVTEIGAPRTPRILRVAEDAPARESDKPGENIPNSSVTSEKVATGGLTEVARQRHKDADEVQSEELEPAA